MAKPKKITLYSVPNYPESEKLKQFFIMHGLPFTEISADNENLKKEIFKLSFQDKISIVKIHYNHGISVVTGFNEFILKKEIDLT